MRPRIGLTTYWSEDARFGVWETTAALLPATYVQMVADEGGIPLLLPPHEFDPVALDGLDGLIVTGGPDVDPAGYGAEPHPRTVSQPLRDRAETAAIRGALERDLPLFAICRGAQLLNVVLGGTLHQHVPDLSGNPEYQAVKGVFGRVEVITREGSLIRDLLGERADAACYHHQSIDRLGTGLESTAAAADGTIEAVELPGRTTWTLGVQFHPEETADDRRLVRGLLSAAAGPGDQYREECS